MLLVDDDQARFRELNFFFQQSMCADDELRVSLRNVAADFAFAIGFQATLTKNTTLSFGTAYDGDKAAAGAGISYGW